MNRFASAAIQAAGFIPDEAMPVYAPLAMPEQDLGSACVNHDASTDWSLIPQPLTH